LAEHCRVVRSGDNNEFPSLRSIGSELVWLPSLLPWIFLLLGTPVVIFLSICTPPFQSPDEFRHFERAYQISNGGLYGRSGGYVDQGIEEVFSHYSQLPFNPRARVAAADESAAACVKWTGRRVYRNFSNTAVYPPIGYLPQTLGVALGRIAHLSIVRTLILSRLLNAVLAILISVIALHWCRSGRLAMFAILLLPMVSSLFGSCNQDASLISTTCLVCALISHQLATGVPLSLRMTIVLALALLILSLERPPYMALLLVLLIPGMLVRWRRTPHWFTGVSLAAILAILTMTWWVAAFSSAKATTDPNATGTIDARMQLLGILHHPAILPVATINSYHHFFGYAAGFIGNLGWMDTPMPLPYYGVMGLVLLVAVIGEMTCRSRFRAGVTSIIFIAILLAAMGILLIEYLTWTPVGARIVDGIQGRYLIPLAIAAGISLPCLVRSDRFYRLATATVVFCQLLTFFYLPGVIIERYYLR